MRQRNLDEWTAKYWYEPVVRWASFFLGVTAGSILGPVGAVSGGVLAEEVARIALIAVDNTVPERPLREVLNKGEEAIVEGRDFMRTLNNHAPLLLGLVFFMVAAVVFKSCNNASGSKECALAHEMSGSFSLFGGIGTATAGVVCLAYYGISKCRRPR